jgi:hypothetical protein
MPPAHVHPLDPAEKRRKTFLHRVEHILQRVGILFAERMEMQPLDPAQVGALQVHRPDAQPAAR